MNQCLFCKIIERAVPSTIVHETDAILAFNDIGPQAKYHVLIVPKKHIPTLNDVGTIDDKLMGQIVTVAIKIAKDFGIEQEGYRLAVNCNKNACQSVFHLHFHLLGGEPLGGNMAGKY